MNCFDDDLELSESDIKEIEEKQEALRDVYGESVVPINEFSDNDPFFLRAREQLQEALAILQGDLKQAYEEALKKAPDLVEKESNKDRFLRGCDYDPWSAAQRLGLYWQKRIEIFGKRAFLPMDVTGNGALSRDIVECMKCAWWIICPPDRFNRAVIVCDRNRLCSSCLRPHARIQTAFYILQLLFGMDNVLNNGYVVIFSFGPSSGKRKPGPAPNVLYLVQSGAIPIKLKAFHLCVLRKRTYLEDIIPIWLKVNERCKFVNLRTAVHYSSSEDKVMEGLKEYGMLPEHIPSELGGKLVSGEYLQQWMRDPAIAAGEDAKPAFKTRIMRGADKIRQAGSAKRQHGSGQPKQSVAKATTEDDAATKVREQKRQQDIQYHREKRTRQKEHVESLKEQVEEAKREKITLLTQYEFLKAAHDHATEAVAVYKKEKQCQSEQTQSGPDAFVAQPNIVPVVPARNPEHTAALASNYNHPAGLNIHDRGVLPEDSLLARMPPQNTNESEILERLLWNLQEQRLPQHHATQLQGGFDQRQQQEQLPNFLLSVPPATQPFSVYRNTNVPTGSVNGTLQMSDQTIDAHLQAVLCANLRIGSLSRSNLSQLLALSGNSQQSALPNLLNIDFRQLQQRSPDIPNKLLELYLAGHQNDRL